MAVTGKPETMPSVDAIESWDFRACTLGDERYDAEDGLFLGFHFTHVLAVESVRVSVIDAFVKANLAEYDGEYVTFAGNGDKLLAGWKGGQGRFRRNGRLERDVVESLRRELRQNGRILLHRLPPMPGFAETVE
jgi:hypothetical protein